MRPDDLIRTRQLTPQVLRGNPPCLNSRSETRPDRRPPRSVPAEAHATAPNQPHRQRPVPADRRTPVSGRRAAVVTAACAVLDRRRRQQARQPSTPHRRPVGDSADPPPASSDAEVDSSQLRSTAPIAGQRRPRLLPAAAPRPPRTAARRGSPRAPAAPAPAAAAPAAAPAPAQPLRRPRPPVAVNDPAGAQAYAARQLASYGWAADQMQCLQTLWTKESDWNTTATNASSGAYGVVQSLPAEKMASAGADYLHQLPHADQLGPELRQGALRLPLRRPELPPRRQLVLSRLLARPRTCLHRSRRRAPDPRDPGPSCVPAARAARKVCTNAAQLRHKALLATG